MSTRSSRQAEIVDPTSEKVAAKPRVKACTMGCAWLLVFLLPFLGGLRSRAQSRDEEYRIKAAFLFHFAQLVNWPPETRTGAEDSLFLCTMGGDPFQGTLESTVAGKAIGDRLLRIRHLKQGDDVHACHVLFLDKTQSKRIPMVLANLDNAPVLTVGESPGFLGAGGMICFVLEGNNVRFEINLDAATSAKLKIGSRLLILAQTVIGESRVK